MPAKSRPGQKGKSRSDLLRKERKAVRCKAVIKRTGEQCKQWAPLGMEVCRYHGGGTAKAIAKANQRLEKMEAEFLIEKEVAALEKKLGGKLEKHPLEAMIEMVQEAAANVEVLRYYIKDLNVAVDPTGAIAIPEQVIEFDKGGTHVPARIHIMVDMYNQERDRLVRYSKLCLDAGVDERRVRVAELQAQRMAQAFATALDDVPSLTGAQRDELRSSLATRLRRLATEGSGLTMQEWKES